MCGCAEYYISDVNKQEFYVNNNAKGLTLPIAQSDAGGASARNKSADIFKTKGTML